MKYENQLTAVVVLGQMNPAILSHDFLERNSILPADLRDHPPVPTITPVLSILDYEKRLTVIVEQERFVAQSTASEAASFLPHLVVAYFQTLPFTPLKSVGVNFQGNLTFSEADELVRLRERLAPGGRNPETITGSKPTDLGVRFRFPSKNFQVTVSFDWITAEQTELGVSVNYHRELGEQEQQRDELGAVLDGVPTLLDDLRRFVVQLVA